MTELTDLSLYDSEQVKKFAQENLDLFSGLISPETFTMSFPDFYQFLWHQCTDELNKQERSFDYYALGLPRGHAKSTFVKFLVAYAVLYTDRHYILVVGANASKAEAIISDVCDMLDSPNIQAIFGNWRYQLEVDRQNIKKFTFNGRSVILDTAGYGTAIRGTNQKNERPDFIVFDDAQTKECAESTIEATAFQQWFLGTALKAKSPIRCLFMYVGNMYKDLLLKPDVYACMLRNLQRNPRWKSFIVGGILKDMTALWEELQPLKQLLTELEMDISLGQADIFMAEVMNCPDASNNTGIDVTKFQKKDKILGELHQGCFITIDPATSKRTPDQVVVLYNEIFDGVAVATEMLVGKLTGPDIVKQTIKLALDKGCSLIVVEANAYQYSLCEWFNFFIQQHNIIGLTVMDLYTRGVSKNSRLMTFMQALVKGQYKLGPKVINQFIAQATSFDPKKTDNLDDILDAGEMSMQSLNKFRGLIPVPGHFESVPNWDLQRMPTQDMAPTPSAF